MTEYAQNQSGQWQQILSGSVWSPDGDVQASIGTIEQWSDAEREAWGVFAIEPAPEAPQGQYEVSRSLEDLDGRPAWIALFSDLPEEPEPVTVVRAGDLWERLSDDEAEQVEAAIGTQTIRIQNIFRTRTEYHSDHEMWPLLVAIATQLFGADRATELLAPS